MDATSESALHPRLRLAHYPSGYAFGYDPTGRCDKKEFLLKFGRDRHRYLQWLFEAKKRFGLSVLNYVVTSNHVHLLVKNNGERDVIPNSIQLIAGRTGQGFNQRKPFSGYNEIQRPRERYAIVDYEGLAALLNFKEMPDLADAYRGWIEEAIGEGGQLRDGKWSESISARPVKSWCYIQLGLGVNHL